jgi:hypothetical protein
MTELEPRTREAEIDDAIGRMEAEAAAFVAATTVRAQEWTRERIERYVVANYARTLAFGTDGLAELRVAADQLVGVEIPERLGAMLGRRDDIWMHRNPVPGRRGLIEYDGGDALPYRVKNAINAALGRVDRLLDEYGYLQPGMSGGAGFDPTPHMRRTLLAYTQLQPELTTLLAQDHAARRVQRQVAESDRDAARDDAGRAAALRAWELAAKPVTGKPSKPAAG